MINEATSRYIVEHADADVRQLALQGCRDTEVDLQEALRQIAGRRAARAKLPTWAATDGIVYPPHLNMEQCSSEPTARYKAQLTGCGDTLVDLTGGFGIDFYWMSQGFAHRVYVEQNPQLCDIASHNFTVLAHPCTTVCGTAEEYLRQMAVADVVYIDPARRDVHGARTYSIADCTPDVAQLLPLLRERARRVIVKLSPMLDWHQAVAELQGAESVHIVSVGGECKELLIIIKGTRVMTDNAGDMADVASACSVVCVNLTGATAETFVTDGQSQAITHVGLPAGELAAGQYLYEPNASIMKAGCFADVAERFGVRQLAHDSHLFVSPTVVDGFPGRRFRIDGITTMNRRELRRNLVGITSANIAVRNFPMGAVELRRRLHLTDGGETYIFGTTLADGTHTLLICRKH